jgi:serine/threonine protein kinase
MQTPSDKPNDRSLEETLPLGVERTTTGKTTGSTPPDLGTAGDDQPGSTTTQDFRNIPDRYTHPETIGTGGIGVVTSCLDPNLGRRVALKTLRRKYSGMEALRQRFVREARVMSQLEHPNIVPVHELGERPDGTVYFTMKQVHGESLEWVLQRLSDESASYLQDYPQPRLLDIFTHICQAVAFAHSHGVIHRDLKPENVMIGAFGEVQIMDWGLVKLVGGMDRGNDPTFIHSEGEHPEATLEGQVAGTPLYMAPEQARGEIDRLDQRSDVYSLGAILYRILTRQQYVSGPDVGTILELVKTKQPTPPHRFRNGKRRVPRELSAICMKAMAKEQDERYQTVQEMIDDLDNFERGLPVSVYRPPLLTRIARCCHRHPVISMSITTALGFGIVMLAATSILRFQRHLSMVRTARQYKQNGDEAIGQAVAIQDRLNYIRSVRRLKAPGPDETALMTRLQELQKASQTNYDIARLLYTQAVELAKIPFLDLVGLLHPNGAEQTELQVSSRRLRPICQEVLDTYRRQIDCAILGGDYAETRRLFELMEPWFRNTPGGHELTFYLWRARIRRRLEGYGTLQLEIQTPGAEVKLYHLTGDLSPPNLAHPDLRGASTLTVGALRQGSYLLLVSAPEHADIVVPVYIEHDEERVVRLRMPDSLPADTVYVPAGPAITGGPFSPLYRYKEMDVPGFFIKKHEVTFAEYLEFWRAQKDPQARQDLAAYIQLSEGAYCRSPAWNDAGELLPPFQPDMPVVGISKQAADAYCQWLGRKLGREVRLPTADEWEKAARGVDGRTYPWGNGFRWDYAHLEETEDGDANPLYAKPGSYPVDRSVYGAMDMGGNVREWTSSPFPDSARRFQIKGGSLATSRRYAACAFADSTPAIPTDVGFRYVVPVAKE